MRRAFLGRVRRKAVKRRVIEVPRRGGGRRARRGVTLIELMVGMVIGLLLTTAAVAFVRSESRLMGVTEDRLDMVQASRVALKLISSDLRSAGLGTRPEAGEFRGLLMVPFALDGVTFGAAPDLQLEEVAPDGSVSTYGVPVQDLGVRLADGPQATVVSYIGSPASGGSITVCHHAGLALRSGDVVLLQDQPGISTQTVLLRLPRAPEPCGDCRSGCVRANFFEPSSATLNYRSNTGATQNYDLGQMYGDYKEVVWFVVPDPDRPGRGALRRKAYSARQPTCTARDNSCGALVARNVEALFYQVYQFAPGGGWSQVPAGVRPRADARVRIDVELVTRAEESADQTFPQVQAQLAPAGPISLPTIPRDRVARRVFRATVELRNSGRI